MTVVSIGNFLLEPLLLLLPFLVLNMGLTQGAVGWLLTSAGAGTLLGSLVIGVAFKGVRRNVEAIVLLTLLIAGLFAALAGSTTLPLALAATFSLGVAAAAVNILVGALFGEHKPDPLRGRVFAVGASAVDLDGSGGSRRSAYWPRPVSLAPTSKQGCGHRHEVIRSGRSRLDAQSNAFRQTCVAWQVIFHMTYEKKNATTGNGRVLTCDVGKHVNQEVTLAGWVHRIRNIGQLAFIVLRDRAGMIQVVYEGEPEAVQELSHESVIEVAGIVRAEPRAPGGYEVHASTIRVLVHADTPPFPVNSKTLDAALDTQLDYRVMSLRHPTQQAIFRVQAVLADAFREFLRNEGFIEVHTPKIVAAGTEGGTDLFPVSYFDRRAYLAQSPQFYKQLLVGSGFERVYEIGPVFRAEPHQTSRHLNEYISMDVEMGFISDESDLLAFEERLVRYMFEVTADRARADLALLGAQVPEIREVPVYTLAEARQILESEYHVEQPEGNLDPRGERLFSDWVARKHGSELVFITRYPAAKRPFYTMRCPEAPELTRSFDLLFRGLEVTTGGQRIHEYAQLKANMEAAGLDPAAFAFYLQPFRFGFPPHGGFAIGLERLTAKLLGLSNVRQASLFPRDVRRLVP